MDSNNSRMKVGDQHGLILVVTAEARRPVSIHDVSVIVA